MPLIVLRVNATALPFRFRELNLPELEFAGNMASSPFAPDPTAIPNERVEPFQASDVNDEPLRPSSHVSN
jgi:hypothetical protein